MVSGWNLSSSASLAAPAQPDDLSSSTSSRGDADANSFLSQSINGSAGGALIMHSHHTPSAAASSFTVPPLPSSSSSAAYPLNSMGNNFAAGNINNGSSMGGGGGSNSFLYSNSHSQNFNPAGMLSQGLPMGLAGPQSHQQQQVSGSSPPAPGPLHFISSFNTASSTNTGAGGGALSASANGQQQQGTLFFSSSSSSSSSGAAISTWGAHVTAPLTSSVAFTPHIGERSNGSNGNAAAAVAHPAKAFQFAAFTPASASSTHASITPSL